MESMTEITIEELQEYFDDYIARVEEGEVFLVKSTYGNVVLMPVEEYEDIVRICNGLTD